MTLINKEKLIKALEKHCGSQRYLISENVWGIINEFPESCVWLETQYVLPREGEEVMILRNCTQKKHQVSIGYYDKDFGWYDQAAHHMVTDVIAWQPKPEPMKKEEENYE